jgi:hypothetical protein
MKGLPRNRLGRRSSGPAPQETQATIAGPEPQDSSQPLPPAVAPQDAAPARPSFRDRGRLRRRLRYLRRVRELGFRDLGGLVFDLHRFGERRDELVLGKLQALDGVDRELRALERVLDDRRDVVELREPGIAGCPRCGALHGTDARFCPACGVQFGGATALGEVTPAAPSGATPPVPPPANAPAPDGDSAGRNAGDQPTTAMSPVATADDPAAVTGGGDIVRRGPAGDQPR